MNVSENIYLDYAAATPLDGKVLEAMKPYLAEKFYNPSADYGPGREVKNAIESSRQVIAGFLGAKPAEVTFTAGGTEANNLAILGIARKYPEGEFIASGIEHSSVYRPLKHLQNQGRNVAFVNPGPDGLLNIEKLKEKITDKTVLLSIIYAHNEVGVIQPMREIATLSQIVKRDRQKRGIKMPFYVHTDACQATQYLGMRTSSLGVDLMSINSGKIYGPKQIGALFIKAGVLLDPVIFGGGQERGLRSGTENTAGIVGFSEAIRQTGQKKSGEIKRMKGLQAYFLDQLNKIPNAQINGSIKHRLPNNIHVSFEGVDNERLLMELDQQGIFASAGSACSAGSSEPSRALKAMGIGDGLARSSIRFSMGRQNSKDEIDKTMATLKPLVVR